MTNILKGLLIFQQYFDNPKYQMGAEHEVVYVWKTDRPLSKEHVRELISFGWYQHESEYDGDGYFRLEHYVPENNWAYNV